jgi:hypothetical protein
MVRCIPNQVQVRRHNFLGEIHNQNNSCTLTVNKTAEASSMVTSFHPSAVA